MVVGRDQKVTIENIAPGKQSPVSPFSRMLVGGMVTVNTADSPINSYSNKNAKLQPGKKAFGYNCAVSLSLFVPAAAWCKCAVHSSPFFSSFKWQCRKRENLRISNLYCQKWESQRGGERERGKGRRGTKACAIKQGGKYYRNLQKTWLALCGAVAKNGQQRPS